MAVSQEPGTKKCLGRLHKGEYVPLSEFRTVQSGKRAGKPQPLCLRCEIASGVFVNDDLVGRYLFARYPVKPRDGDKEWWVWAGTEWLPRYGSEMLGDEF